MDGKKTVLATALMVVMAVMWIRVLVGHKPGSVAAAPVAGEAAVATEKRPAGKARMVELPRILGRNDSIGRDCFNMQEWAPARQSATGPSTGTDAEVPVVSPNRDQEVVRQVAQTLRLGAVSLRSENPQAFLNDRLLGVGDTLTVEHGSGCLEFEVLQISDNAVLVECKGIQLALKLAPVADVRK
jgi:hypothetical protein